MCPCADIFPLPCFEGASLSAFKGRSCHRERHQLLEVVLFDTVLVPALRRRHH